MIPRKQKICKTCGCARFIFSRGNCQQCAQKQYKKPVHRAPVKKISAKYQQLLTKYSPARKAFLAARPNCELRLEGCTRRAECVHHKAGKATEALYLDQTKWMASCIACNRRVEEIGARAYELGLKIKHTAL